mgnify:CR=1 FL=1
MNPDQAQYIQRCARLSQKAMRRRKYRLAYQLASQVPGAIGVDMKLLIMEHEFGYHRAFGEVV